MTSGYGTCRCWNTSVRACTRRRSAPTSIVRVAASKVASSCGVRLVLASSATACARSPRAHPSRAWRHGLGEEPPIRVHEVMPGVRLWSREVVRDAGIRAPQQQVRHALGVARGVGDRDRPGVLDRQERSGGETETVMDRLQVAELCLEAEVDRCPIREPGPAEVVADDQMALAETCIPVTPGRYARLDRDGAPRSRRQHKPS